MSFFLKRKESEYDWTEQWILIWNGRKKSFKEKIFKTKQGKASPKSLISCKQQKQSLWSPASGDGVGLDQTEQWTQSTSCKTRAQGWGCGCIWGGTASTPSTSITSISPQDICLWRTTSNLPCPIFDFLFTSCESYSLCWCNNERNHPLKSI